jgi:cysteine desulfuration protein SufE
MSDETLPPTLAEISEEFLAVGERDRLQLLLEFSRELPALPPRLAEHPELLERVVGASSGAVACRCTMPSSTSATMKTGD